MMSSQTDGDGRCTTLLEAGSKLSVGTYKMVFHTGAYFQEKGIETLYPLVEVRPQILHSCNPRIVDRIIGMRRTDLSDNVQLRRAFTALSYPPSRQSVELHYLPR